MARLVATVTVLEPKASRRFAIAARVVGLVLASVVLTGMLWEAKALFIATGPNPGGGPALSQEACESVPCQWEVWVGCDGRITALAGVADDGSVVYIDYRVRE